MLTLVPPDSSSCPTVYKNSLLPSFFFSLLLGIWSGDILRMCHHNQFQLLTSFVLPAELLQVGDDAHLLQNLLKTRLPTLDLHLTRLFIAHQYIAEVIPNSWCAKEPPIDPALIMTTLHSTINSHKTKETSSSLRVRLTIGPSHTISLLTSPMPALPPSLKLLVCLDDQPTPYKHDPFLLTKTTHRDHYDQTRERHGKHFTSLGRP
jgi:hypothetical protein